MENEEEETTQEGAWVLITHHLSPLFSLKGKTPKLGYELDK